MRIELVAANMNPSEDNDVMDEDEGFVRVYRAHALTGSDYVRGDFTSSNCGDWHRTVVNGPWKFYPAAIHNTAWFVADIGALDANASTHSTASFATIMTPVNGRPAPRCFLGGDPHLVAIERNDPVRWPDPKDREKGGQDTTFTAVGTRGEWLSWPGAVDPKVAPRYDAAQLFPLYRQYNTGTKQVITVKGTVGLSGVLRGRITMYALDGHIVLLDDTRYASDPKDGDCSDILGLIASKDIVVADNALNTPQNANGRRNFDDTKDFNLHAVMMALGTSFRVEDYNVGVAHVNGCEGTKVERGCLYLAGGIIQQARGAVGFTVSGGATGFSKRYSYDRCASREGPPYYPTTGRYSDNRYYEVDPVGFDVAQLFKTLSNVK
jgi:hypothetical protein